MSVNEVMVGVDPIAAAEQRGRDETQPRREFCFTCPSCGNPFVDTVEPSVDIHSGATYKCADCGGSVVFTAETTEQYVKREQAEAKLAEAEADRRLGETVRARRDEIATFKTPVGRKTLTTIERLADDLLAAIDAQAAKETAVSVVCECAHPDQDHATPNGHCRWCVCQKFRPSAAVEASILDAQTAMETA